MSGFTEGCSECFAGRSIAGDPVPGDDPPVPVPFPIPASPPRGSRGGRAFFFFLLLGSSLPARPIPALARPTVSVSSSSTIFTIFAFERGSVPRGWRVSPPRDRTRSTRAPRVTPSGVSRANSSRANAWFRDGVNLGSGRARVRDTHDGFSRPPSFSPRHKAIHEDGARDLGGGSRAAAMRAAGLRSRRARAGSARGRRRRGGTRRASPGAGAHRGARSASCAGLGAGPDDASAPVREGRSGPRAFVRASRSAHVTVRNASGRGRRGSDEPSRDAPAHRVNDQITARQVRLVIDRESIAIEHSTDSNDTKTKTHEVLSVLVALRRAKQAGLDLVEVNARADPPVCRLMRYDSFRYAQKQKEREGRRAVERPSARIPSKN